MPKTKKVLMPKGSMAQKAELSGSRGSYLTRIPDLERESLEEIEVIPIREPFTYSRVVYDHDRSEYIYEVWEPQLDDREKELRYRRSFHLHFVNASSAQKHQGGGFCRSLGAAPGGVSFS